MASHILFQHSIISPIHIRVSKNTFSTSFLAKLTLHSALYSSASVKKPQIIPKSSLNNTPSHINVFIECHSIMDSAWQDNKCHKKKNLEIRNLKDYNSKESKKQETPRKPQNMQLPGHSVRLIISCTVTPLIEIAKSSDFYKRLLSPNTLRIDKHTASQCLPK